VLPRPALAVLLAAAALSGCARPRTAPAAPAVSAARHGPLRAGQPVRGWTILSDSEPEARAVVAAARGYDVNHLELSHEIVHDLKEVRDARKRGLVNRLTDAAHAAGVQEVVVWDHALYDLDHYPARFRTGPGRTLDLDDPALWAWIRQDYREMLDLVPAVDGIVLTFIETGARAERQHSARLATPEEKLAAVVNAVADVVVGERKLNLYARTFAYTDDEYRHITRAVERFARPEIRLLMKETPHDFFLTHPNDRFAGTIARPTVIEFDVAGEFNGQGLIASTWPEYVLGRARDLLARPHVIGYTARTDRYGATRIVGRPAEVDLYALTRWFEDRRVTAAQAADEFIARRYGAAALPHVRAAFANAFDIVTSVLYTLGTNVANHSALDYDPYNSSWARHVSGKWLRPPVARVGHGVDVELHYWKDVVDRLAPPWAKAPGGAQWGEVRWVVDSGWITPGERMDARFLGYVVAEKEFGVRKAEESLAHVAAARTALADSDHVELHRHFERTLLTARLHRAVAKAYFGFRVWARGGEHRTSAVERTVREGLREIREVAAAIEGYPAPPPAGQWDWVGDARQARRYAEWITTGWPRETRGFRNPYGGVAFPE
jgi:hypothetical protein